MWVLHYTGLPLPRHCCLFLSFWACGAVAINYCVHSAIKRFRFSGELIWAIYLAPLRWLAITVIADCAPTHIQIPAFLHRWADYATATTESQFQSVHTTHGLIGSQFIIPVSVFTVWLQLNVTTCECVGASLVQEAAAIKERNDICPAGCGSKGVSQIIT